MRGNSHVQFLGGPSSIRMEGYPTEGALPALIGVNQACGGLFMTFTQGRNAVPKHVLKHKFPPRPSVSYSADPGNHKATARFARAAHTA